MDVTDRVLTIDRAATVAEMSARTLRKRIAEGAIPALVDPRDRRRKLIRTADLKKYLGREVPLKLSA